MKSLVYGMVYDEDSYEYTISGGIVIRGRKLINVASSNVFSGR